MRRGPQWMSIEGHVCQFCGVLLERHIFTRNAEPRNDYLKRRFCSIACSHGSRRRAEREDGFQLCHGCDEYRAPGEFRSYTAYCRTCQKERERVRKALRKALKQPPPVVLPDYVHLGVAAPAAVAREVATRLCADGLKFANDVLATVPAEAPGLIAPRFQTASRAKLWNDMLYRHTGRRSWES